VACGVQEYLANYYAGKPASKPPKSLGKKSAPCLSSSPPTGGGPGHTILKKSFDPTAPGANDGSEPPSDAAFTHSPSLPNRHAKFRDVVEIVEFGERDQVSDVCDAHACRHQRRRGPDPLPPIFDLHGTHGPRNDFIVGVAKGQLLPKIYKYAYTKMAPIEVFEGAVGVERARPPGPQTSSAYGRGPLMCWSPAIILTQSRVRCTVFVNIIDCVVSAAVEQFYISTFKFCLLKIQEICPVKCFIFASKCTKMRLVAGLRRDPLGELTALPQVP